MYICDTILLSYETLHYDIIFILNPALYLYSIFSDLLGDLLKKRPKETDGIDSVIVVDNVPSVGPERLEKLQNVIRRIFSKFGKIQTEHYPTEEDKTKGWK